MWIFWGNGIGGANMSAQQFAGFGSFHWQHTAQAVALPFSQAPVVARAYRDPPGGIGHSDPVVSRGFRDPVGGGGEG